HMGESRSRRSAEVDALKLGIELGMTHIDTAEMYGRGAAEEIVGDAIRGWRRESLFLVSKVLPANATYKGTLRAAAASLRRLGTDYLDLYLLHWREELPLSDTLRALEDLTSDGTIRALGVSNFDVDDLEEASTALRRFPLACNQVLYNLADRGIERDLLLWCRQHDVAVVGYTPMGGLPSGGRKARALQEIATRHTASVAQVVLAFLTRDDGTFAIPKASDPQHVRDNAAAGDLALDADDIALIDSHFPAPPHRVQLGIG
ncbi:MAG TPA: aldo/keto reductase, partial [Candidatus Margulisiibacteriota bacterium]|nr:aldo/keto reductase [Candidatus Margulisiibacteriota bacterium]